MNLDRHLTDPVEFEIPDILRQETILWAGVDATTPDGCYLVSAHVVGLVTTYIVRHDGVVLGRIEPDPGGGWTGAVGVRLKGGTPVFGYNRDFESIANEVVDRSRNQGVA